MLYAPLHFKNYESTGAVQSAIIENELRKIQIANSESLLKELAAPEFKIQIANGTLVTVKKQIVLKFSLASPVFEETFHIEAV